MTYLNSVIGGNAVAEPRNLAIDFDLTGLYLAFDFPS
jgi:hypothetical protein